MKKKAGPKEVPGKELRQRIGKSLRALKDKRADELGLPPENVTGFGMADVIPGTADPDSGKDTAPEAGVPETKAEGEASLFGEYDNIINVLTLEKAEINAEIGQNTKRLSAVKMVLRDLEDRRDKITKALEDARELSGPPEIIPDLPAGTTAVDNPGGKGDKES